LVALWATDFDFKDGRIPMNIVKMMDQNDRQVQSPAILSEYHSFLEENEFML